MQLLGAGQCALLTLADFGELHHLKTKESEVILKALNRLHDGTLLLCRDYRCYDYSPIVKVVPFGRTLPRAIHLLSGFLKASASMHTKALIDYFAARRVNTPMVLVTVPRGYVRTLRRNRALGGVNIAYEDFAYPGYSAGNYHRSYSRQRTPEIELLDHVLVLSSLVAKTYLREGFAQERVHCIGLGGDPQKVEAACQKHNTDRPLRVLCLGSDKGRKGFARVLEAWKKLSPEVGELRIVGIRSESVMRKLNARAGENVTVKPFSDPTEDLAWADVLFHPAKFEPFGRVVTEAMAFGKPVVVSDMTGAMDIVEDGLNGFVIPTGDTAAIRERLEWCRRNRDVLARMGVEARRTMEQKYTWRHCEDRIYGALRSIVEYEEYRK